MAEGILPTTRPRVETGRGEISKEDPAMVIARQLFLEEGKSVGAPHPGRWRGAVGIRKGFLRCRPSALPHT